MTYPARHHTHRRFAAPHQSFPNFSRYVSIDDTIAARAAGRLELPMAGHGYLYAILAGMADKQEAQAEQQREQQLRTGPRAASVNGPASVSDLVQPPAVHAAPRPAPAAPAGMSPTVRAMREQIAKKKGQP